MKFLGVRLFSLPPKALDAMTLDQVLGLLDVQI